MCSHILTSYDITRSIAHPLDRSCETRGPHGLYYASIIIFMILMERINTEKFNLQQTLGTFLIGLKYQAAGLSHNKGSYSLELKVKSIVRLSIHTFH